MSDTADRWLDRTIADAADAGVFGTGGRFASFASDGQHGANDQFASIVYYGTVTVTEDDLSRRRRILVKLKHRWVELRNLFRTDLQFHNEILFYEKIAPSLVRTVDGPRAPSLCRYFYGRNECGRLAERDLIVLENATWRHGYRSAVSDHPLYLDFDHLIVALRTLAKFHGLSYRAKHADRTNFLETLAEIEEVQWFENGQWLFRSEELEGLLAVVLDRMAENRVHGDNERAWRFRKDVLQGDAQGTLRCTMEPAEPLAVLCHGDYNRNNMMFLYDDDGGRPVDALLFDMATVRYGSPALDLSFFLYMNTDRQTRDAHWDELLDAYCTALAAAVSDVTPAVPVPDRAQLDAEMRERGFYGLAHASFFTRIILEEHKTFDLTRCVVKDRVDDDRLRYILSFGGDTATAAIVDAFRHFIDIGYAVAP